MDKIKYSAEERIKKVAELITDFLKKRDIEVNRIIVFGSQAEGNFRENSDVDIAIISKDFEGKDIFQKAEMLKGLNWFIVEKVNCAVDIVPVSLKEWQESSSLIVEYIKEGQVLV